MKPLDVLAASLFLPAQELCLLNLALAQIDEEENEQKADQAECKQEIEGCAVVVRRTCVDDCRRDQRTRRVELAGSCKWMSMILVSFWF